jgi:predicted nucleic acid-binding protein
VLDGHTPEVLRLLSHHPVILLTPFHETEFAHAIAHAVFRRQITAREAALVRQNFYRDHDAGFWRLSEFPLTVFRTAIALADRHVPHLGVRTLDTLHVASALELKAERFWTFDDRQKKLAKAVGLKTS